MVRYIISIHIKRLLVSPCVCNFFHPPNCLSPETNISHTQGLGANIFTSRGRQTFLRHGRGGGKHFLHWGGGTNVFTSRSGLTFMLEAVVAMTMFIELWMWVKRTFLWVSSYFIFLWVLSYFIFLWVSSYFIFSDYIEKPHFGAQISSRN